MPLSRRLNRNLLVAALSVALACATGPWLLYGLGLEGVAGKPALPTRVATSVEQAAVWHSAQGVGEPVVARLNPYTYLAEAAASGPHKAGVLVAWQVASEYVQENRRYKGMHWWHLSGAALTIWLTRNWSVEQILSKRAESEVKNAA